MNKTRERRIDGRLLCAELVELIWHDARGRERRGIANLEDISSNGMCLQLESPVHAGTEVRMLYGTNTFSGIVRYVVYRDEAYFVGVELAESSRWSNTLCFPARLVDPDKVRARGEVQRLHLMPTPGRVN